MIEFLESWIVNCRHYFECRPSLAGLCHCTSGIEGSAVWVVDFVRGGRNLLRLALLRETGEVVPTEAHFQDMIEVDKN